jgi:thioredoxin reductase
MNKSFSSPLFAVVGAGPYGLAVASHLRAAGFEVCVFGRVMDFWDRQMPRGMLLRSPWDGSHISDPQRKWTLDRFEQARGKSIPRRIPVEDFVDYGKWLQGCAVPDLDTRLVTAIDRIDSGFRLTLEDGEQVEADEVVAAAGIASFPRIPGPLSALPPELVSHTSAAANHDLARFAGRHVAVVGGGQSAVESAALLCEAGVRVELLVRRPALRWLKYRPLVEWLLDSRGNLLQAPGKIGPVGIRWLIEHPFLFTRFPQRMQDWMAYRSIGPAAASWLRQRVDGVVVCAGQEIVAADPQGNKVRLRLSDGAERIADHVLLGTGYQVDLARYSFLPPALREAIRTADGYPVLNWGFESSVPGLYFVGATAARSFGPLCRFVAGTRHTAVTLTRFVRRKPRPAAAARINALMNGQR